MGCTIVNGAVPPYHGRSSSIGFSTTYKMVVYCDGKSTEWATGLGNNVVWLDGTAFYRQGINLGPTAMYKGAGQVVIKASQLDHNLASRARRDGVVLPATVTDVQASLTDFATLTNGQSANDPDMKIYEFFQLTFTGGYGECSFMCV